MALVNALYLLLLRLRMIDIEGQDLKKEEDKRKWSSGADVLLRLGRTNDSMAIMNNSGTSST
jgi:hypothetical protein